MTTNCEIVQHKILGVQRATKRKNAWVRIAINDETAKKIIEASFCDTFDELPMWGLALSWNEPKKEEKES